MPTDSVRFLRYDSSMLPLDTSGGRTIFCVPQISALVQVEEEHRQESLKSLIAQEFPAAETIVYEPKAAGATLIDQIGREAGTIRDNTRIVFLTYNAHIFTGQHEAIRHFSRLTGQFAVAALRNPYDLSDLQQIKTCVATFGFRTPAIKALLHAFKGTTPPVTGPWPIDITGW